VEQVRFKSGMSKRVSSLSTAPEALQFKIVNVTHKSLVLVEVHHNLKRFSPNASNCDEETEVFLLLLALALHASLQ